MRVTVEREPLEALHADFSRNEPTATAIREHAATDVARVRRLARVKPYGLDTPLTVTELLPPAGPGELLSNPDVAAYEQALDAFLEGEWNTAYKLLHQVPPDDRGKGYGGEMLEMVLRYSFFEMNLYRITVQTFEYNERAQQLLEKHGFQLEVRRREAIYWKGRYWDTLTYGLLAQDWLARTEAGK
jgi:GNAT superfamily N-acetyltransferase